MPPRAPLRRPRLAATSSSPPGPSHPVGPPSGEQNETPQGTLPVDPSVPSAAALVGDGSLHRSWVFTYNNPTPATEVMLSAMAGVKYMIFGRETAPTTGTRHLQGFLTLVRARSFDFVRRLFGGVAFIEPAAHIKKAILYCKKGGDFVERGDAPAQGKRTDFEDVMDAINSGQIKTFDQIIECFPRMSADYSQWCKDLLQRKLCPPMAADNIVFKYWQAQIFDQLIGPDGEFTEPSPRTIYWVWSEQSGTGKTEFFKYLGRRFPDNYYPVSGFAIDNIAFMLNPYHRVLHLDIARQYSACETMWGPLLETLSNRCTRVVYKYQGAMRDFARLHVVVTANIPPPHHLLPGRFVEIQANRITIEYRQLHHCEPEVAVVLDDAYYDRKQAAQLVADHVAQPVVAVQQPTLVPDDSADIVATSRPNSAVSVALTVASTVVEFDFPRTPDNGPEASPLRAPSLSPQRTPFQLSMSPEEILLSPSGNAHVVPSSFVIARELIMSSPEIRSSPDLTCHESLSSDSTPQPKRTSSQATEQDSPVRLQRRRRCRYVLDEANCSSDEGDSEEDQPHTSDDDFIDDTDA